MMKYFTVTENNVSHDRLCKSKESLGRSLIANKINTDIFLFQNQLAMASGECHNLLNPSLFLCQMETI